MADKDKGGASAPEKTSLELAKAAQVEVLQTITEKRFELIETLLEYKSIGGDDKTKDGLLEIVLKFPQGIPYPFLQTVFPEMALTKARDELKKEGRIQQIGKKGNVVLKPVVAAQ